MKMKHDSKSARDLLKIILCLAGLLVAGSLDYQDQQDAEKAYCKHVETGQWPDYRRIYDTVCVAYTQGRE